MINVLYFTAFLLIFLRIISVFMVSPIFFPKGTPKMFIIFFCAILSFIILPTINYSYLSSVHTMGVFIFYCIGEVLTGMLIGYIIRFCFFAISFAGQLIDMQIGFAMMNMFDPQTGSNVTILSNLMYWISVIIFFLVDGHHILIKNLIQSFSVVKLGTLLFTKETAMIMVKAFIDLFTIGFKIALPIILILIITDLVLTLVGRTVPQLNVMILGLPLKILIGLATIAFALPMIIKLMLVCIDRIPVLIKQVISFAPTLPILFIFDSEDKTEEATPKKKQDARKKGQVAKSKEVGLAFTLLAATIALSVFGDSVTQSLEQNLIAFLGNYMNMSINGNSIQFIFVTVAIRIALGVLPIAIPILILGVAANFAQSGFLFTKETIKPDFKKLNPISGFKRMFSMRALMELVKDLAVICVVAYVGYKFILENYSYILIFCNLRIAFIPQAIKDLIVKVFFKVTLVMVFISLADFIYQKFQYKKELKMSKQEVKEEFKQDEGDPQIKGKRRQMQREMASRRMMQSVPDATVVVTNPTHISIALKYNDNCNAPIVVAKGQDRIAAKIKEIARENDVPIIENKPLARLMYKEVEINSEIPVEMYEAVAEVLAVVYKMNKKK